MSEARLAQPPDLSLLQGTTRYQGKRHQRALILMAGLMLLFIASAVTLIVYLKSFETDEEIRTQSADALWVEENVRFHLRRLETDLYWLAQRALEQPDLSNGPALQAPGGSLRSHEGGLLAYGWQPAGAPPPAALASLWDRARQNPLDQQALDSMHDVAQGLRRPSYAGPLMGGGSPADEMWLSVPFFERGEFVGSYVAVFSLRRALELIIPAWFRSSHHVEVLDAGAELQLDRVGFQRGKKEQRFLASLDMPGSDTYLRIYAVDAPYATVPRALLGTALVFLIGMIASLALLRRDMDKRQAAEDSLAAQIALRRAMEDSIGVGLFARDSAGAILYANRAFCDMVGYRDDTLPGRMESLRGWPEPEGGQEEAEIEFRRDDGTTVTLLIHRVPLRYAHDRQIGWMSSVLDITDRRKAEKAALVQQQRLESAGRLVAIGEVASTLAHELNQPLGALSSFASGLLNRLKLKNIESSQVESVVERISTLAEKTGQIIQRVNAFARRREMQKVDVDLNEFLRGRYPTAVLADKVRLELKLPPTPVIVKADIVLFEQVVRNVVQNAAEAAQSSADGLPRVRLELTLPPDGGQAFITVSDNGAGIDKDSRARIFDAFYSSKKEGMGMGLAICRSILEAHHGGIELRDDSPLPGTSIRFWIPANE